MNKKWFCVLLVSLLTVIGISSTGLACNRHMTWDQYNEAVRRAGVTDGSTIRVKWEEYLREYCEEYKPNPNRKGWIAPWGARYCPRCGAKGDYIGDYDSYGIQVVFECQYRGCGYRWLVQR